MPVLDIPGLVTEIGVHSTTVGGGSEVTQTNDGDTSYLRQLILDPGDSNTGYNDHITFPATSIPGEVTSVSLVTVTKGTDSRDTGNEFANGALFLLNSGAPDFDTWLWFDVFANGATDWTEKITDLSVDGESTPVNITKAMLEAGTVQYGSGYALLNETVYGDSPNPTIDSRWTYIALRVVYEGGIPPRRIFGRNDGLTHGARRTLGGGNSRQSGSRTLGSIL